jgi:hypothetical protein
MKPTILLSLLFCAVAQAQMPPELVNAERAKILDGVKSVPKAGAPGPVGIWGQIAFPILSAPDKDGVEIAVAAAAAYQKGRFILFGHNSYLGGGEGGDHAKLMENCVKWAGNKEKPRVGLKGVNAVNFYKQRGFNAETFDTVEKKNLGDYDVVIINIQGVTSAEEGAALAEYIRGGGGFIGGMTGWAYGQTSGGKDLTLSHGVNQALLPAGIAITDMSAFDQLRGFDARIELPQFMNASDAISAIKKQRDGGPALTAEQMKQGMNSIQIAMAAQPPDRGNLKNAVAAALGNAGADAPVPKDKEPLTDTQHAAARLRLGMETRMLRLAGADGIKAHPAHVEFPGKAPEGAPRITGEVKITPSIPAGPAPAFTPPQARSSRSRCPKNMPTKATPCASAATATRFTTSTNGSVPRTSRAMTRWVPGRPKPPAPSVD